MPGRSDRSRREHFVVGPQWVERTPERRPLTDDMMVVRGATEGEADRVGRGKARAEGDRTSCAVFTVCTVLYCTVPYRTVPYHTCPGISL
jgi:hypothetical protein